MVLIRNLILKTKHETQPERFPAKKESEMLREMERWVVIKSEKEEKNIFKLQWNLIEIHELPLGNQRRVRSSSLCSFTHVSRFYNEIVYEDCGGWDELSSHRNVDAIRLGIIVQHNRLNRINSRRSSTSGAIKRGFLSRPASSLVALRRRVRFK